MSKNCPNCCGYVILNYSNFLVSLFMFFLFFVIISLHLKAANKKKKQKMYHLNFSLGVKKLYVRVYFFDQS